MPEAKVRPRKKTKRTTSGKADGRRIVVKPLEIPELQPEIVQTLNAFYRRRSPIGFTVAGEALTIAAGGDHADRGQEEHVVIRFNIDSTSGAIECPSALIESPLEKLQPDLNFSGLAPHLVALLLECALDDEIGWLEAQLETGIELISVEKASGQQFSDASLALTIGCHGEKLNCRLQLINAWAQRLSKLLDERQSGAPTLRLDIPASVIVWRTATILTLSELQSLAPGDVIVLDDLRATDRTALILMADHFLARAQLTDAGCALVSKPFTIQNSNWEWIMDRTPRPGANKPEKAGFEDLPVTVAFEIGRKTMALSEVSALAPGAVIQLADTQTETVSIIAQGKQIGQGEIVRIGDALGVRIARIFGDA